MDRFAAFILTTVHEQPIVVGVLLTLIYATRAAGRWAPPMLLDAGLLGLYIWRPSAGSLAFGLSLCFVRHVPTLSSEVARLFRLDTYNGWTAEAVLFFLPSLAAFSTRQPLAAPVTTRLAPQAAPAPQAEIADDLPLLFNEAIARLNIDPTAPQVGVVGATRLGKTTLVGLLLHYRQGSFVVTTPKGAKYDPWFGFPAIRVGWDTASRSIDWTAIGRAIESVHFEMLRRNAQDTGDESPITLVIDELTTTIAALPHVAQKIIDMWTMGAGAGIRLIVIATDVNVRGWKIEGRRDVIDNLVFAKVEDGRQWSIGRIDPNGRLIHPRRMDTRQVLDLAATIDLGPRLWPGLSVCPVWVGGGAAQQVREPAQTQTPATDGQLDDLIGRGYTREAAATLLAGLGFGLDNTRWAERRAALGVKGHGRRRRPTAHLGVKSRP